MLATDKRARIPGEEALWRYKRGAARVALGRLDAGLRRTCARDVAPSRATWVQGRARVELGRLALKRATERRRARRAGRDAVRAGNDPVCVEDAQTLLRSSDGR